MSRLSTLSHTLPERIATRITLLVESSPDPAQARRFLARLERECPAAFERIASSPAALRYSISTFAYSHFLGEAVLRYPEWLLQITTSGDLHRVLTADDFAVKLIEFLGPEADAPPSPLALARFRRRMLVRILLRDVLGMGELAEVTEELSNLSDAILEFAYRGIRKELAARHGTPLYVDLDGEARECGFAVISLGKLGGKELNYSSDIDLMFLYTANGFTDGAEPLTNKEFFKKVANRCIELLSTYTAEGFCYRVDLRLRPDGQHGEICISLDGARQYYKTRGRDWELQMLIKARASAGDRQLARDLLEFVEPMIYSTTTDFRAVEAVSEARDRIGEKLAAKSRKTHAAGTGRDIKLCPGGIRDIEFLVQCLQRLHGGREPWVRHGGTLFALSRLRDKEWLSGAEYSRLAAAYEFLRRLEHLLQVYDDRQTHTLSADRNVLGVLARKMPASRSGETATAESLEAHLEQRLSEVQEVYRRVIHAHRPMYYSVINPADEGAAETAQEVLPAPVGTSNLTRFLDQKAPQVAAVVSRVDMRRNRDRFEHFLEKAFAAPDLLTALDSKPALVESVIDIFEHSQYFSDQLIRTPELVFDLEPGTSGVAVFAEAEDAVQMRRTFRRAMLRVQGDSILRRIPIFTTLEQTSDLADGVICEAYRLAVAEALRSTPPAGVDYTPSGQMMVIALGRLGMREFDLASDADLCFVIPDRDSPEQVFWTSVAERMIDVITSYTGDGVIFTVDTRLRPNGGDGALVQTESSYKDYFAKHAEAWEGISYMKARCVAGAIESATEFLHELQEVDWRRYGQNGRSRSQLAEMRGRLERDQGSRNPLKAGRGGYYDIDFALMYLRLRGAGIFYKVLNTPQRIDVIEKMGHLERDDADALRESAAFYRSIDHGLRIWSGQVAGKLPASQMQLEVLTELVGRWAPPGMNGQPLAAKLVQVRKRTRELFDHLFG